jgi:hypothetical protein
MLQCSGLLHCRQVSGLDLQFFFFFGCLVTEFGFGVAGVGSCWRRSMAMGLSLGLWLLWVWVWVGCLSLGLPWV